MIITLICVLRCMEQRELREEKEYKLICRESRKVCPEMVWTCQTNERWKNNEKSAWILSGREMDQKDRIECGWMVWEKLWIIEGQVIWQILDSATKDAELLNSKMKKLWFLEMTSCEGVGWILTTLTYKSILGKTEVAFCLLVWGTPYRRNLGFIIITIMFLQYVCCM